MSRNPLAHVCHIEGYFNVCVVTFAPVATECCSPAKTAALHVHRLKDGQKALIYSELIVWWRTDGAVLNGNHWAVLNWAVNPAHWQPEWWLCEKLSTRAQFSGRL